jgi:hypothetical protein
MEDQGRIKGKRNKRMIKDIKGKREGKMENTKDSWATEDHGTNWAKGRRTGQKG